LDGALMDKVKEELKLFKIIEAAKKNNNFL
jgi:hypothetical protein